jgi:eukaryotic-like serine/threonine-protein kinase
MATSVLTINARYQVKAKPLGQGGMGVVYTAYDIITKRDVAVKTMRGTLSPEALELFSKEWSVLARVSHPNIVDILDTGEFEQDGERKPFFVMPLLPGATLERLIETASTRLTVERIVGIAAQTCRGLQAAHEHGLVHRDLKPSNIFVMDDDTVKIIDFGVVHLAGAESIKGIKGTLQYMAPEQVAMKGASAASDIFSLGVVCYQALTGRKPFARKTEAETVDAVMRYIPPPVCELNPLVSQIVSRVIHKAMAKAPWHRFSTAREFSETLQKALNGQPIERFDREKIQPRIDRAKKAQLEGDYQFVSEILTELEAEGNIDPEMTVLRIQLDQGIRQKSIRQLLDSARVRLEEDEFPLALQKIQEVLGIDPDNADALHLRKQIEKQSGERQTENWFQLAEQHLHNHSFGQARQALSEILKLNARDNRAREMLSELDRQEQEINRLHAEKEQLYQSAVTCYQHGEVSSALSKLERVLELHRQSPDSAIPDRDAQYQSFYNQIRTEKDAARSSYAEGRRYLTDKNFGKALALCEDFLKKSPGDPMFQALKLETEEQQRQEQSAFIAEVARREEGEADLDRRVNILKEAVERYPDEPHFQKSLRLVKERRDLVNSIVGKARQYEERGQYNEALSQFDILRNIYAQYPGIEFESERLKRRRDEQVREEAKSRWVEQIDRNIGAGDYAKAWDLVRTASSEFLNDGELSGLERLVQQALERAAEADEWLQRGQKLCFDREFGEGLEALRKAASLDNRNAVIRAALLNALVEQARALLSQDWRAAEPLIEEALNIDSGHPLAKSLQGLVLDYKRQEILNDCVSQVREMQAQGDLSGALAKVDEVLATYPNEVRLTQLRKTLLNLGAVSTAAPVAAGQPDVPPASPKSKEPAQDMTAMEAPPAVSGYTFPPDLSLAGVPTPPQTAPVAEPPKPAVREPKRSKEAPKPSAPVVKKSGGLVKLLRSWAGPQGRFSKLQWGIVGAAAVILASALVVGFSRRPPTPKPVLVPEYVVVIESNVPGAKYLVDGNPPVSKYRAGTEHNVTAEMPGYKPAAKAFTLSSDLPKKPYIVSLQLEPELARLELTSDLKSGKVSLDGGPPEDLKDGNFDKDGIALSTDHTFSLTAGTGSLEFSFHAEPAKIVTLTAPPKAKDIKAWVIAGLASTAHAYASDPTLKAGPKDHPETIPPEGVDLGTITADTEITVDDGKSPQTYSLKAGRAPTLTIFLGSDPNSANVHLEGLPPGADVLVAVDRRTPIRPHNNYLGLLAGPHTLRFTAAGYDPVEQKVDLKKGERQDLHVELKVTVRTATLTIEGATPQAEVLLDGAPKGTVDAEGSFSLADVPPGEHTVGLRKADFEPKQVVKAYTAGQTVHISGAEGQLKPTPVGTLAFRVSPSSATVTYRQLDESQMRKAENGQELALKAGRYEVAASAPGYQPRQESVTIESGKTQPIGWTLAPTTAPSGRGPVVTPVAEKKTPDYFQDPGSWTLSDAWWIHKGTGTSWLIRSQGAYRIEFLRKTSKVLFVTKNRRVDWVIDAKDSNNQIEYLFDFKTLVRRVTVGGNTTESKPVKLPAAAALGESYAIEIEVGTDRIVIKDAQGKELDQYQRPNPAEPLGKFGFKGEVGLVVK